MAEGAAAPMAGLAAHSQCMQVPLSQGGHRGKGGAHESGNGCWSSRGRQATLAENQSVP